MEVREVLEREVRRVWLLLKRTAIEFSEDDCFVLAAAVAYFALASIFPLFLLSLAGAGRLLGSREAARDAITQFFSDFLPGALGTLDMVIAALVRSQAVMSVIAVVGLLWTGSQIIYYLEMAMNFAWDCPPRPWWKSRLRAVILTLIAQVLLILYFTISLVSIAQEFLSRLPGYSWLGESTVAWGLSWSITFSISVVIFVSLNKFLPNHRVSWGAALFGGLISSLLFEAARFGFHYYLDNFASYDVFYGSIGGLVIILAWVYYAALITLLGAELASEMEEIYLGHRRVRCPSRVGGGKRLRLLAKMKPLPEAEFETKSEG